MGVWLHSAHPQSAASDDARDGNVESEKEEEERQNAESARNTIEARAAARAWLPRGHSVNGHQGAAKEWLPVRANHTAPYDIEPPPPRTQSKRTPTILQHRRGQAHLGPRIGASALLAWPERRATTRIVLPLACATTVPHRHPRPRGSRLYSWSGIKRPPRARRAGNWKIPHKTLGQSERSSRLLPTRLL